MRDERRWWPIVKDGLNIDVIAIQGGNLVIEFGQSEPMCKKWDATLNGVGGIH